jgi:adenylate cyclase
MQTAPDRKLTTIVAADAAGYSAMMERDEIGTLALLKTSREMMTGEIERYRGRVVGTSGDGLLAEFASVVNAVECAVRVQRALSERNAGLAEPQRMRFRIGVNLGDVMVDGDDLFGEGVNIAARLQALAEPGGILISGAVFDQVRTKLSLGFDFLGPQTVKNISEAVPAWRVLLDGDARGEQAREIFSHGRKVATEQPGEGIRRQQNDHARQAPQGLTRPLRDHPLPTGEGDRPARKSWFRLKRHAAVTAILIAVLFTINVLTYHHVFWFQWPTLGFLTLFALRAAWTMGR